MPATITDTFQDDEEDDGLPQLPFPPVTKSHILHCSYHYWHPRFRNITPKARLIPLTQPFLDYLRADGIVLPSESEPRERAQREWSDTDSGVFSASDTQDSDDDEEDEDVAAEWRPLHTKIRRTIIELDGKVVPKLNWSAPKDATFMNNNTMTCQSADDVYLLLKSSDFVTHDLEHAFDDCVDDGPDMTADQIPYHLVLRKSIEKMNPSMEFRCFVRGRRLLCMCQRDLNYYKFLDDMSDRLRSLILEFFEVRLRHAFPDDDFVFDVYIPAPHDRVWLVDFNPWAPRTDPLLFGWLELLTMDDPVEEEEEEEESEEEGEYMVSLEFQSPNGTTSGSQSNDLGRKADAGGRDIDFSFDSEDEEELPFLPELRLVQRDDPEANNFATPQYSAHKLPKDVVDASQSGEGLREFARDWQKLLAKRQEQDLATADSEAEM